MLYFAYGSNMFSARMKGRVSSSVVEDSGYLYEHKLAFHKVGRLDSTGKCDAHYTGMRADSLIGVLYRIDSDHRDLLDTIEGCGNGYERKKVGIKSFSGKLVTAFTYCASHIDPAVKPFHWYKKHVLAGAKEHAFPNEYISLIESIESIDDHDTVREQKELRLHTVMKIKAIYQ